MMCGICGTWKHSPSNAVHNMVLAMNHRGPDDSGIFSDQVASLGMARLSIIDVTPTGHQPMETPDGLIHVVYNGEMYNFRQERICLEQKGEVFTSTSDTEVVLKMYAHYGDDFLLRMRGMFAVAVYDRRGGPGQERLLLARDQLGIKPLLYSYTNGRLVFASELKALLSSKLISSTIDPVSLRLLLTFGSVNQPRTMLNGVKMLLPAHRLIIEADRHPRVERYWTLSSERYPELKSADYQELVGIVSSTLRESVGLQMVSDVPLGAFLSGGVDSSILVAMMAEQTSHKIKTFSVGFGAEGADMDESDDARQTAQFIGTDHTHVVVEGKDVLNHLQRIAAGLDQPSVDGVNTYFVSLAARQTVKVALSGTGGDELFAGYSWFADMARYQRSQQGIEGTEFTDTNIGAIIHSGVFDRLMTSRFGRRLEIARNQGGFLAQYASLHNIFGSLSTASILSREMRYLSQAGHSKFLDLKDIDELADSSLIARVSALCLRGYASNQLLRDIDAVSMAHSLEVRVPYLDTQLTDIALSLPDNVKWHEDQAVSANFASSYRHSGAKRILIDAGRPLLPPDFDLRPKRGFGMPFNSWLRGPLKKVFCEALSDSQVRSRGWLDVTEVARTREGFLSGSGSWPQPWLLMMLELWAQEVLDSSR